MFSSGLLKAQEQILISVVAGGGGIMNNETHNLAGTIGQPLIGVSSNPDYYGTAGFWYGLSGTTDVEENNEFFPSEFLLLQNYPNPFNPATIISYQLPVDGNIILKVYDLIGNEVATLVNEEQSAGRYEITFNASNLSSGVYFYRIQAGSFNQVKKMILLR